MEGIEAIRRIWEADSVLWNQRVVPSILEPLERKGGLDTNGLWDHVLATAFGRSQKTFESIQLLVVVDDAPGRTSVVLGDQVKSLDWKVRKAIKKGAASSSVVAETLSKLQTLR